MKLLLKNFREINQFTYISYFYETSLTDFSHLPLRITVVVWGNDGTLVILRKNYVKSTYSILNYTTALWVIFKKEFFFSSPHYLLKIVKKPKLWVWCLSFPIFVFVCCKIQHYQAWLWWHPYHTKICFYSHQFSWLCWFLE